MCQDADVNTMIYNLQTKFNDIIKWCLKNKLTVNRDKTKFMLVSPFKLPMHEPLNIGNVNLSTVSQYEYFGMLLDNKLAMMQQIDNVYKQANSKLGILCKIRRYMTESTAVRIYTTMIRPHNSILWSIVVQKIG